MALHRCGVHSLDSSTTNPFDADFGGGIIKHRIARPRRGKSKGYRTILLFRKEEKAFFVFGFGKGEQANISKGEEAYFKLMVKEIFGLSTKHFALLLERKHFEELTYHDQEI